MSITSTLNWECLISDEFELNFTTFILVSLYSPTEKLTLGLMTGPGEIIIVLSMIGWVEMTVGCEMGSGRVSVIMMTLGSTLTGPVTTGVVVVVATGVAIGWTSTTDLTGFVLTFTGSFGVYEVWTTEVLSVIIFDDEVDEDDEDDDSTGF